MMTTRDGIIPTQILAPACYTDHMTPSDQFNTGNWTKAIYYGLPVQVQQDAEYPDEGVSMRGFWSYPLLYLPFNGLYPNTRSSLIV